MRFLRQSMIGLFLTALTFGLLAYAVETVRVAVDERLSSERRAAPARERVFSVGVVTASLGTEVPDLETFGEVQSRRSLEVRAAAAGRIIWLADGFEDGGRVSQGDVLLRIDPADAQAAFERAQVDVQDAQAELTDALRSLTLARDETQAAEDQAALQQRAFQRQKDLEGRGVGTAAAMEAAELSVASARQSVLSRRQAEAQAEKRIDQARTGVARADIALADAERMLADTSVTAPFDGVLTATNVVEGRLVANNEKLADLIDPHALDVKFRVSTAQYARLIDELGNLISAPVTVTIDAAGVDLVAQGRINRISAGETGTQSGRLIFARLEDARGFQQGDFVTVSVAEPALERVARLPAAAYDPAGDVLIVTPENRLERLPVQLVRRQGDDVLVRGQGLNGREVVEARSPLLGAGIQVKPIRRGAAAQAPQMVELTDERRAKLLAFVEANTRMPKEVKQRILSRLNEPKVPAEMVNRLENRMGG